MSKFSYTLSHKLETNVEIKASAQDFHDMFWNRPHHVSNTCDDKIHACDIHEGDFGTVGSIVVWQYTHKKKVSKEVVEAIDPDKNSISFRVIEGDLMKEYKTFVLHIQATPKSVGNSAAVHWTLEYQLLHDEVLHPKNLLEFCMDVSEDIDAHLLANK